MDEWICTGHGGFDGDGDGVCATAVYIQWPCQSKSAINLRFISIRWNLSPVLPLPLYAHSSSPYSQAELHKSCDGCVCMYISVCVLRAPELNQHEVKRIRGSFIPAETLIKLLSMFSINGFISFCCCPPTFGDCHTQTLAMRNDMAP